MKTISNIHKLTAAGLVFAGASCSVSSGSLEDGSGEAQLFLTGVPADVSCVRVTVAGARKVIQAFPVVPGDSAQLSLNGLSLGSNEFSADAFNAACSAVIATTVPEWISTPVTANIAASSMTNVSLVLRRNGQAQVAVSFEEDPETPDPCAQCIVHPTLITSCETTCSYTCQAGLSDCDSDLSNGCETSGSCEPTECGPLINEIQVAGPGGAADEFIEIASTCATDLPLDGVSLVYRSAAGVTDVVLRQLTSLSVPAGGYVLLAGAGYTGTQAPGATFSSGLAAAGAGLALVSGGVVLDAVGYGAATNIYVEGTVAGAPATGSSLSRIPDKNDTQNNQTDFASSTPTPGSAN